MDVVKGKMGCSDENDLYQALSIYISLLKLGHLTWESQGIESFCETASSCGFKEPLFYNTVG